MLPRRGVNLLIMKTRWAMLALLLCACTTKKKSNEKSNSEQDSRAREKFLKLKLECEGCHTERRIIPSSRFGNGLGRWSDTQCYGCHKEINEIAIKGARGDRGAKYSGVPVSREKLKIIARKPLSYMSSPDQLDVSKSDGSRYDRDRLVQFLRRPARTSVVERSAAPKMVAFPKMNRQSLAALQPEFHFAVHSQIDKDQLKGSEVERGRSIWLGKCQACHAQKNPVSGRTPASMSVFSSTWIHEYANATSSFRSDRAMPRIPLSRSESRALFIFFGAERRRIEHLVDQRVKTLDLVSQVSLEKEVAPQFAKFMWSRFLRDATCVHCHATSPRAAKAFTADADGLRWYLKNRDPSELWRRLEIRAIEAEHGLGAEAPGMPMAGEPIAQPIRDAVGRWILAGCKDELGTQHCEQKKSVL